VTGNQKQWMMLMVVAGPVSFFDKERKMGVGSDKLKYLLRRQAAS
jgi:hypothetical protein